MIAKRKTGPDPDLGGCDSHPFEHASDTCRTCARAFCPDCLVYAFGPRKQPLCLVCALAAAGIRRSPRARALNLA